MRKSAIHVNNVSKCYKRYSRPVDRLKEVLLPNRSYAQKFWALQNINLDLPKGETIGIVGQNGSGKSTLLQIIAGTLTPTMGNVQVNGRVSALLELGSGFSPDFTGRQNVIFNGQLLGLSRKEIEEKFDEIVAFADIGDFIEQPVKTYSSGMFVRLAFAVAINVDPEILIVDEALSVGDGVFVHRCMARIEEFQNSGGTILFVSHDIGSVSRLCSKVIWINEGKVLEIGEPFDVCKHYQAWMYEQINKNQKTEYRIIEKSNFEIEELEANNSEEETNEINLEALMLKKTNSYTKKPYKNFENIERFGTGKAEIIGIEILGLDNKVVNLVYPNEVIKLRMTILTHAQIEKPIFGCTIYDRLRTSITAWNTYLLGIKIRKLKPKQFLKVTFIFTWPELNAGSYGIEPAVADGTQENHEMLDWLQCGAVINSAVTQMTLGIIKLSNINTLLEPESLIEVNKL